MLRKLLDALYLAAGWLAGGFLVAILLLMLSLSVGREFGLNVQSGDDIASWCMAALGFLGLAHTFKRGELIRMGLVVENVSGWVRRVLEVLSLSLGAALTGYFAWHAGKMIYESWLLNEQSTGVLVVPLWIPQLGVGVGIAILLIAILDELVRVLAGHEPSYAKAAPKTREDILQRASEGNL